MIIRKSSSEIERIARNCDLVAATIAHVGERLVPGQEPQRIFEMDLKRVGDTDWPAAGPVAPR